ncbi:MAG: hypothetical protein ABSG78_24005, partial [Verrucomicrobiota bacterium]
LLPAGGSSTRQQLATPTQKHLIARTHHHHNPSAMNFRRALILGPFSLFFFTIPLVGKTPCKTANTAKKVGFF